MGGTSSVVAARDGSWWNRDREREEPRYCNFEEGTIIGGEKCYCPVIEYQDERY